MNQPMSSHNASRWGRQWARHSCSSSGLRVRRGNVFYPRFRASSVSRTPLLEKRGRNLGSQVVSVLDVLGRHAPCVEGPRTSLLSPILRNLRQDLLNVLVLESDEVQVQIVL